MSDMVARTLDWLRTHQAWAGPALGLLAAVETLPAIGVFAPLTASIIAVGAGVAAGVFHPTVILWVTAGCAFGNGVCFESGVWAKRKGLATTWIPARPRQAAEALFQRWGPLAVIIGRFAGLTASVTPFLAGWCGLDRLRFWLANLAVCLVWPLAMAAVGYLGVKTVVH